MSRRPSDWPPARAPERAPRPSTHPPAAPLPAVDGQLEDCDLLPSPQSVTRCHTDEDPVIRPLPPIVAAVESWVDPGRLPIGRGPLTHRFGSSAPARVTKPPSSLLYDGPSG